MKIHRTLDNLPPIRNAVLTQGTFDGVHQGHLRILNKVTRMAQELGGESVVLTFYPHPRLVLYPDDQNLKLLTTLEEKAELMQQAGIDHLIVLPFTSHLSQLSPLQFVREILVEKIGIKKIVIGYDHRFGHHRSGTFSDLEEMAPAFGFEVEEIPAHEVEDIKVSSTRIRQALTDGNMEMANQMLGRPYFVDGIVVKGRQLGRELGYPTLNIEPGEPWKLIPRDGVYAVCVKVENTVYPGMANIGNNPTVPGKGRSLEAHLFDFNREIYTFAVRLEFHVRTRDEIKFNDLEALKKAIGQDEAQIRAYFRSL